MYLYYGPSSIKCDSHVNHQRKCRKAFFLLTECKGELSRMTIFIMVIFMIIISQPKVSWHEDCLNALQSWFYACITEIHVKPIRKMKLCNSHIDILYDGGQLLIPCVPHVCWAMSLLMGILWSSWLRSKHRIFINYLQGSFIVGTTKSSSDTVKYA